MRKLHMQFFLAAIISVLMQSAGSAKELIIYDMNSRGNPGSIVTEKWMRNLEAKDYKITFKAGVGCAARDAFMAEDRSAIGILFAGRMWGSLDRGEDQCVIDFNKAVAISSYQYSIELCTRVDSTFTAEDLFKKTALKIGSNGRNNPHGYWVSSLNQQYETNHIAVATYANSRAVSLAVLSGEIDFGLISRLNSQALIQSGKISCVATTDRTKATQFQTIFPRIPALINNFNGVYGILARNLSAQDHDVINKVIEQTGVVMQTQGYDGLSISKGSTADNDRYIRQIILDLADLTKTMQK